MAGPAATNESGGRVRSQPEAPLIVMIAVSFHGGEVGRFFGEKISRWVRKGKMHGARRVGEIIATNAWEGAARGEIASTSQSLLASSSCYSERS